MSEYWWRDDPEAARIVAACRSGQEERKSRGLPQCSRCKRYVERLEARGMCRKCYQRAKYLERRGAGA